MDKIDELKKAMQEAAGTGESLLKKSQMGFDFAAGPNPHHAAYTRTSASGTVSNVKQKGAQTHHEMVAELHGAFEKHDRRGRGGMGIGTEHPDYATPEKYLQTAKNILKYRGHERLGHRGANAVEGILNRHIGHLDKPAEDEQPVTVQAATAGPTHVIPARPSADEAAAMIKPEMTLAEVKAAVDTQHVSTEDFIGDLKAGGSTTLQTANGGSHKVKITAERPAPSAAVKSLITQVETAATNLMAQPGMEAHRAEVDQMISELHKFPSAGHASAIVGRLVDINLDMMGGAPHGQSKADWEREVTDHVIKQAGVSNGDAQGMVEVHDMKHPGNIDEHHAKGTDPKEVAKQIIAKNRQH